MDAFQLPLPSLDLPRLFTACGEAGRTLARFVGLLSSMPYGHILLGRKHEELRTTSLHRIIDALEQAGVFTVRRPGSGRKPTLYQLPELTRIAEGKSISRFDY